MAVESSKAMPPERLHGVALAEAWREEPGEESGIGGPHKPQRGRVASARLEDLFQEGPQATRAHRLVAGLRKHPGTSKSAPNTGRNEFDVEAMVGTGPADTRTRKGRDYRQQKMMATFRVFTQQLFEAMCKCFIQFAMSGSFPLD